MAHVFTWVARLARVAACSAVAACSNGAVSTQGPLPGLDGGTDATSSPLTDGATPPGQDANGTVNPGDTGPRATACTAAPFVNFSGTLTSLALSGATQPLAGAAIGFSTCPGFDLTTNAAGSASTQITEGIPVSPIYSAGPTILGTIGAEIPATADVSETVTMFAFDVSPSIPGFEKDGGNAATIAISLVADPAATAPCTDVTGVTLAVTGHAEAIVSYATTAWPGDKTVTTTSSTGPYVFINGVTGATRVALTGAKTGCTVKLVTASQTGSFVLVPGSVTVGTATVGN
jgi:hypothetical protein